MVDYSAHPRLKVMSWYDASMLGREPLVFTSIMPTWRAYGKWTFDFLRSSFADFSLIADREEDGHKQLIQMTMSKYIDYLFDVDEPNPYYAKTAMHLSNELKDEYPVEMYFECWYRNWYRDHADGPRKLNLSNMYLAPRNAIARPHNDLWGTSFWNAMFEGKKLWLFFRKEDEHRLYHGSIDPFNPDFEKFPLFEGAEPIVHIQQPGELIYSPGNIWHAVLTIEPSLSLSENFINRENYENVLASFQQSGKTEAYKKMKVIAETYCHESQR